MQDSTPESGLQDSSAESAGDQALGQRPPLRNPFRSEQDAFRLLGIIGAGVGAIVVASLIGGAWLGLLVALILGAAATRATYRWIRQQIDAPDEIRELDKGAGGEGA